MQPHPSLAALAKVALQQSSPHGARPRLQNLAPQLGPTQQTQQLTKHRSKEFQGEIKWQEKELTAARLA
jgi:hypothetical protein